jgi:peptidoglycan/xylan/chitin deacetylase (PgdA/CDA1 family)
MRVNASKSNNTSLDLKIFPFLLIFILLSVLSLGFVIPHASASSTRYIILRFDDGLQEQWVDARPVLNSYGYKGSYFAITDFMGNYAPTKTLTSASEYMSWQELEALYSQGNEIVDHSATHPDMNHLNSSQLYTEVVGSRQAIIDHGMSNIPDFALPYGDAISNTTVSNYILSSRFKHWWGAYQGECGICNYNKVGSVFIPIDLADNDLSLSQFKSFASRASSTFVVGFEFHHIESKASNVNSSNPYAISLAQFKQDIAYIHNNGFTVIQATKLPNYNGWFIV